MYFFSGAAAYHYCLRTIVILGETGTGKSSLCNVLAGKGPNSDLFPVSDGTTSCTQENVYQHIKFGGDREFELDVTVIDTKGFDDSNSGIDEDTVADFIASLKLRSAVVNAFGISIHDITLDGTIVKMMKLFASFWAATVLSALYFDFHKMLNE